jgi:uncharacterized protein (DUF4415 family)
MRDEYDFSDAKRARDVPHLARLQAEAKNKTLMTILLDNDIVAALQNQARHEGLEYQTVINRLLREAIATR